MNKTSPLVIAAFAFTLPPLASAVPLRATFDGSVSGSSGVFTNVLNDFPAGTAASSFRLGNLVGRCDVRGAT